MTEEEDNDPTPPTTGTPTAPAPPIPHGIWIGIDLGTSNCTAAYWDTTHNRSKSIRFRSPEHSTPLDGGRKGGKILPSCVAYGDAVTKDGGVVGVGTGAVRYLEERERREEEGGDEEGVTAVSSVKRIWGMTEPQIRTELELDPSFLSSLPFESALDFPTDGGAVEEEEEGARLCIGGTADEPKRYLRPLRTATDLLRTIRLSSDSHFRAHGAAASPLYLSATAAADDDDKGPTPTMPAVRNCVIGVPAHFGRNRRDAVVRAARNAGFDGYVGTVVESTAAAVAYGLDVGVTAPSSSAKGVGGGNEDEGEGESSGGTTVLVFDMGGGTTDVTVARMSPPEADRPNDEPTFRVLATAGDRHLGGDDMDEALAKHLSEKLTTGGGGKEGGAAVDWRKLRRIARAAKEELCGDGTPDRPRRDSVVVTYAPAGGGTPSTYELNHDEFGEVVRPLVERASSLVRTTLSSIADDTATSTRIDELILVGGATRCPSVPTMLHSPTLLHRHPTADPPIEFCTSIRGEKAVAQGLAVHAAVVSNLVPRHVLRNATMLDVLPHPVGVLLPRGSGGVGEEEKETYVPVLERGARLPATGCATFELADVHQTGVSVTAVEDVGEEFGLERLGEFDFLLHRLDGEEVREKLPSEGGRRRRKIDVGMTIEESGKLIVSVFDENDPEDLRKKEAYQKWKRRKEEEEEEGGKTYVLGQNQVRSTGGMSQEEFLLSVGCLGLFCAYMAVRFWFHEVDEDSNRIS